MSMLETPLGDRAFKIYSLAGIILGILFFAEQIYTGSSSYFIGIRGFELSFTGATILFLAVIPLLKAGTPSASTGELLRALLIGAFAYYPLLYVTWSSLYQLWLVMT
ncbi:MAG: hypothetical protein GSR82_04505 [Desulfurococcales archaeon]|nr:hypothetical protein [Desulfurococcales archaeon]MEB3799411.1 hypothetical protein [Desulfurococcales archaeon]